MKTVLFAWELGGGSGHIARIRRHARMLSRHGTRLVAAVRTPWTADSLLDMGLEVVQAPPWAEASFKPEQRARLSAATMGDALATLGLGDVEALAALLAGWEKVLRDVRPDLVVADYSPAASLLARGRIPLLLTGNGFTLPPSEMTHFPLLHRQSPPVWEEQRLLTIVSKAGRGHGLRALERLPELFSADSCHVETFPMLDPYDQQRSTPVDGPVFEKSPRARRHDAEELLVYFAPGYLVRRDVLSTLRPFARRIRMYAPALSDDERAEFKSLGSQVHSEPFDLPEVMENVRLAIHLGGSGLSAHAIAAGVPQLVVALHIEHDLNGSAVERRGIGRWIRSYDRSAAVTENIVADIIDDASLARRAAECGDLHRRLLAGRDPLSGFEAKALRLLRS